jgi:maltose O-acetyltransferase
MRRGGRVLVPDPELDAAEARATALLRELNATPMSEMDRRVEILGRALLRYAPGIIRSPITWQFGHLRIGQGCFINWDCMFMDNATITLGVGVAVGPRSQFITVSHPLRSTERIRFDPEGRRVIGAVCTTAPIVVEDLAWIGASVIVMPNVTIGARSVIGAGSVVTKSIPPDSLAYGNPCSVVRSIS